MYAGPVGNLDEVDERVSVGAARLLVSITLSTARDRRVACTAGRQAGLVLRNLRRFPEAAEKIDVRPRIYAILRGPCTSVPTWRKSKQALRRLVGQPTADTAVFSGFGSGAESQAYLAGAGVLGDVRETA